MTPVYTARDVCRITGVQYETLNYWVSRGLCKPSLADGKGSGNHRMWSERDLEEVAIMQSLRRSQLFGSALPEALEHLRQQGPYARFVLDVGQIRIKFICDFGGVLADLDHMKFMATKKAAPAKRSHKKQTAATASGKKATAKKQASKPATKSATAGGKTGNAMGLNKKTRAAGEPAT